MEKISPLFGAYCSRVHNGDYLDGFLTISDSALLFSCQDQEIDRIDLASIESVEFKIDLELGDLLVLTMYGLMHYSGTADSMNQLHSALKNILKIQRQQPPKSKNKILFFDGVYGHRKTHVNNRIFATFGALLLSKTHLSFFHPRGGLKKDTSSHLHIPLNKITTVKWAGYWRYVELEICHTSPPSEERESWIFYGESALKLLGYLKGIGYGKAISEKEGSEHTQRIIQSWNCMFNCGGWRAWRALALVTESGLSLVPSSPIDGLWNIKIHHLHFMDIASVSFSPSQLKIKTVKGVVVELENDKQASYRYQRFVHFVSGKGIPHKKLGPHQSFKNHPQLKHIQEKEALWGAATLWLANEGVQLGWLVLNNETVDFIYKDPEKPKLTMDKKNVFRNDDGDTHPHLLMLRYKEEHLCIEPAGGENFVASFYQKFMPPHRRIVWKKWSTRARRITLNNRAVVVQHIRKTDEESVKQTVNGTISFKKGALHIEPTDRTLLSGLTVLVEFHAESGRYTFESSTYRTEETWTPDFFVRAPKVLSLTTERAVSRIPAVGSVLGLRLKYDPVEHSFKPTRDLISLDLVDISQRGVGLRSKASININDVLLLDLDTSEGAFQIQAKCIYSITLNPNREDLVGHNYHYGFRFQPKDMHAKRRLLKLADHYCIKDSE
ncbi:MAG: hypothetical protein CMK59_04190 [Proteobacteria bacterium]|nr:hypothetical protein [Pseudomonadota bacterium]